MIIMLSNLSNNQKKLLAKKPPPVFKTSAISTVHNEHSNKKIFSSNHIKFLEIIESKTKVSR